MQQLANTCAQTSTIPYVLDLRLGLLPQGQPERDSRVLAMVSTMDALGFGSCTNQYECSAVCPKTISEDFIARMNRDFGKAVLKNA